MNRFESAARRLARVLVVLALGAGALGANAAEFLLHVAPIGKDSADGRSPQTPVATLKRALEIARSDGPAGADVVVRFARTSYGDGTLDVDWVPADGRRLVLDGGNANEHASFDGKSSNATWLQVRGQPEQKTNLTVRGFVVTNYRQAIQFIADWRDQRPWMSGNVIEDNVFQNIGQFNPEVKPALAAVHLLNTSDTIVRRNRFVNIHNDKACDGLHAIYMAGGASRNRIVDNVFDGGCGDTIKARDRSNDNVIANNRFTAQTGKAIFVDSFCDARRQEQCEGKQQECPSWNNRFERSNVVDDASRRAVKAVTRTVGMNDVPTCPMPAVRERIRQ